MAIFALLSQEARALVHHPVATVADFMGADNARAALPELATWMQTSLEARAVVAAYRAAWPVVADTAWDNEGLDALTLEEVRSHLLDLAHTLNS